MGTLFPTSSDATIDRKEDPKLLCIDDDRTSEILKALSSDTSQEIFELLNREPLAAQDIADELDLSLQQVSYHLENLEQAGVIAVLDTCYSEKGMEVDVYGPPETPLLMYLGPSNDRPGMLESFKRFAHTLGPIAGPVALGQALIRLVSDGE
jgi:hypothetical protein